MTTAGGRKGTAAIGAITVPTPRTHTRRGLPAVAAAVAAAITAVARQRGRSPAPGATFRRLCIRSGPPSTRRSPACSSTTRTGRGLRRRQSRPSKPRRVEFGASDAPLATLTSTRAGLTQFPLTIGGVVLAVNLDGVGDGQLKLDAPRSPDLHGGHSRAGNDPAIKALNPRRDAAEHGDQHGAPVGQLRHHIHLHELPQRRLVAVAEQYGASKDISWAGGVGGNKNTGVATAVQQTKGSIGYVEYAYAKQTGMATVQLKNKDGQWVKPSLTRSPPLRPKAKWVAAAGFASILVDEPGPQSWPIVGGLLHPRPEGPAGRRAGQDHAAVLRLGLQERRPRSPSRSTTCRCPTTSSRSWRRSGGKTSR